MRHLKMSCEAGEFTFEYLGLCDDHPFSIHVLKFKEETWYWEEDDNFLYSAPEGGESQQLGEIYEWEIIDVVHVDVSRRAMVNHITTNYDQWLQTQVKSVSETKLLDLTTNQGTDGITSGLRFVLSHYNAGWHVEEVRFFHSQLEHGEETLDAYDTVRVLDALDGWLFLQGVQDVETLVTKMKDVIKHSEQLNEQLNRAPQGWEVVD